MAEWPKIMHWRTDSDGRSLEHVGVEVIPADLGRELYGHLETLVYVLEEGITPTEPQVARARRVLTRYEREVAPSASRQQEDSDRA